MLSVSSHIASLSELNELVETLSLYAIVERRQNRKPKIAKWWQNFLSNDEVGAGEGEKPVVEELVSLTA